MKLAAFFSIFILAFTVNAFAACEPGPSQAAFFEHDDFNGNCVIREIGNYASSDRLRFPNDSISSLKLGTNVQVLACEHAWYEGRCELFLTSSNKLSSHLIGNDTISSVKVMSRGSSISCIPSPDQVAFYRDSAFMGACEVRGVGAYRSAEDIGLSNDSISSVKVGGNVQVTLCADVDFRGTCQLVTTDTLNLTGSQVGNDSVSSATVQRRNALPPATSAGCRAVCQFFDKRGKTLIDARYIQGTSLNDVTVKCKSQGGFVLTTKDCQ